MSDIQLYNSINSLPDDLKKKVVDFVNALAEDSRSGMDKKERKFGYAKGFFKMAENFDEPLEDFEGYI